MIWPFSNKWVSTNNTVWSRRNRRGLLNMIKWVVIGILFALFSFLVICRLELNARLYIRQWITPSKPVEIESLSSACFSNHSSNQQHTATKKPSAHNFVPGIPVWEAYTCYDYASLLQPSSSSDPAIGTPITYFHTTWSSEQQPFTNTHFATLRSFLTTQPRNSSELIIWIHPQDEKELQSNELWQKVSSKEIRYQVYSDELVAGTPLAEAALAAKDNMMVVSDPELLKLAVLYQQGGVWFDLNTLFVRDMSPLLGHEWIAQGKCQSSMTGNPFEDGGLWHFNAQSPAVCELLYGSSKPPSSNKDKNNSDKITDTIFGGAGGIWGGDSKKVRGTRGAELYLRIYHNLLRNGVKPWSTLPWCFTDPSQCTSSNSLPSPFDQAAFDPRRLQQTFAFHFKTQNKDPQPNSIYKYLEKAQQW